jgi:hypothetical protein
VYLAWCCVQYSLPWCCNLCPTRSIERVLPNFSHRWLNCGLLIANNSRLDGVFFFRNTHKHTERDYSRERIYYLTHKWTKRRNFTNCKLFLLAVGRNTLSPHTHQRYSQQLYVRCQELICVHWKSLASFDVKHYDNFYLPFARFHRFFFNGQTVCCEWMKPFSVSSLVFCYKSEACCRLCSLGVLLTRAWATPPLLSETQLISYTSFLSMHR